jgi:ADP-ribose pyrophosphatase
MIEQLHGTAIRTREENDEISVDPISSDVPLSTFKGYPARVPVADAHRSWNRSLANYSPPWYESPRLAECDRTKVPGGWADPSDVSKEEFLLWSKTGYMHSYEGPIQHDPESGRPLNPLGRTGIAGRGALGKWGPNHAADAIVTRISPESGLLEMILIQRQEGQWAIPGGMLDPGETPLAAAQRELEEETGVATSRQDAWLVYQGIGDGPRVTDNAWIETSAYHFHCDARDPIASASPQGASDALQAMWRVVTPGLVRSLYANHGELVRMALSQCMLHLRDISPEVRAQIADITHSPLLTTWSGLRGRIGVLGGTFDPVHNSHIELGQKIMRERDLDAIIYIPNGHNPLKPHGPIASSRERVDMLQYALRGEPRMFVSPIESRVLGKSYTIDTLRAIRAQLNPDECSICLIMGSDALRSLPAWKDSSQLVQEAEIIPILRAGEANPLEDPQTLRAFGEAFGEGFISRMRENMVPSLATPLSASEVRAAIGEGMRVDTLVSPNVLDYIERRALYGESPVGSLVQALSP